MTVTSVPTSRRPAIPPRLLTRAQAADYCGVSVPIFAARCPVRPVALGASKRLERYDVVALDRWIDELSGQAAETPRDWLALLDKDHDRHAH